MDAALCRLMSPAASDLMSRSIFPERNRVVGADPDDLRVVEGRQPQSRPRVVREDQESGGEWDEAAVVAGDPVAVSREDSWHSVGVCVRAMLAS